MRTDIVHIGAGELTYEIRNIVQVGDAIQALGRSINWENIGDPIAKGEKLPQWMKDIVAEEVQKDSVYGYCPTKGVKTTREFIAAEVNARGGARITSEDIIFFNGLGDAISKVFGMLKRTARVVVPTPSYTTHSSAEAAHAGHKPITYRLDPGNYWYPDLEDLENHIRYNPAVAGILIINPDNPTGAVYPEEILVRMVELAKKYDLFIICDEIYHNIIYNGQSTPSLSTIIGDVPAIAMRGISKEMPWPGSRCGWIEIYNQDKDPVFARYVKSIDDAKMTEVCATTLPQTVMPKIVRHPEYPLFLQQRVARFERCSNIAYEILQDVKGVRVNRTNGAFYMSVVFEKNVLTHEKTLPIESVTVRALVERLVAEDGCALDKRFVLYLLGATGVCLVPLSSFATDLQGFRVTLLERDEGVFRRVFHTIAHAITSYLAS